MMTTGSVRGKWLAPQPVQRITCPALSGTQPAPQAAQKRVRVRQWITYHGLALNVDPDLEHYRGIVPCGIAEHGVTSLAELGINARMGEVDTALRGAFAEVFGVPLVCRP